MDNKLKILRAKHNFTQQELANALGVTRQTIHSFETGKFNPSLAVALRIADLFREPVENIFKRAETIIIPEHNLRSYR